MRFVLLIYPPDGVDVDPHLVRQMRNWIEQLTRDGKLVMQQPFLPGGAADHIVMQEGKPVIVEGPVSDESHIVCGMEIVECRNKAEAMALAARHPVLELKTSKVEVREVWDLFGSTR